MQRPTHWTWIPGLVVLALEPALWLARTWTEPAYQSHGAAVALLCFGLIARSVASGPATRDGRAERRALVLWLAAAGVRLAGRLLDLDHLGALALVADVGALAVLLRLDRRPWPVAPWALAGLAALSLPVEHVLQQLVSWPLRLGSTIAAASLLRVGWPELQREGTVLLLPDGPLSIAVPCSGASGLVLLGTLAFAIACRRAPTWHQGLVGALAVGAGAVVANTLRIVLLAVGPTQAWLEEPAHTVVGLVALGVGASLPLAAARRMSPRSPTGDPGTPPRTTRAWTLAGVAFSLLAVGIVRTPHRPLDVSTDPGTAHLPGMLGPWPGRTLALDAQERAYFDTYGGRAERAAYATDAGHVALLVATTAPIRHLHSPRSCLQGAGHVVERLGARAGAKPTVVWRTTDPDGHSWRVETTFLSTSGQTADSPSEVVWRWLASPGTAWMLVERVTPWDACERDPGPCTDFDRHLFASIEAAQSLPPDPGDS